MPANSHVMKRILTSGVKVAVVCLLAGIVGYFVYFAPVTMKGVQVRNAPVLAEVMGTGTLEAKTQATISPKIPGRLARVLVDQSDRVKSGQVLATLDDGDLRQQVEVAKAELHAANAAVERYAADITRADARARQAQRIYNRLLSLRQTGAASVDEYDKATEDREIADAELEKAKLTKIEAERQAQRAEQSLRYYQERLADTRIVAPFDGLIVRRVRDPGDVLVPGGTILDLVSTDQLWVSAWVDETAMSGLTVGQRARVVFRSEPDQSYPGAVARVSPQTDRESRELVVDIALERLPKTWAVGQRAEVYIVAGQRDDVRTLPQQAIVWREKQPGVIVSADGKAHWQNVVLGLRGTTTVEIVQGLGAEQTVVVVPPDQEPPRDGRTIRVK